MDMELYEVVGKIRKRSFVESLWHEIKRYCRSPRCLVGHVFDPNEGGTDGKTFDYYCARCQKRIKSEPLENSLGFKRFKKICDEEGIDLSDLVGFEDGNISP